MNHKGGGRCDVPVLLDSPALPLPPFRPSAELGRVINACPFIGRHGLDESKLHVTFLRTKPAAALVKGLGPLAAKSTDEYKLLGSEIYLHCPNGEGKTLLSKSGRQTTINMSSALQLRPFGNSGVGVTSLGLSASYYPGRKTVRAAVEEGINLFFAFGIDVQMTRTLRELMPPQRDKIVLVTGAYNYIWWAQDVRKTFEKRLRQFNTEYIDVFLFMGVMKPAEFTPRVHEELLKLKEEGKVRAIGISSHNRAFLGKLAADGDVNALMLRYNAAHRGAERDIFPYLAAHNPGVISYTATRWTSLLRRPKGWPENARVPTAGDCYRFVLSNPHVHTVLMAPRNERELRENISAVHQGPLNEEDMKFMREFGDAVYKQKKWFM